MQEMFNNGLIHMVKMQELIQLRLESMHKNLKYMYLDAKKVKKLYKRLYGLNTNSNFKSYEVTKMESYAAT